MALYVHDESNTEYTTGLLVMTTVILLTVGWISAGAIAAVPAFFGAVTAAGWVWGLLGGLWTGNILVGLHKYRQGSRKIEGRVSK